MAGFRPAPTRSSAQLKIGKWLINMEFGKTSKQASRIAPALYGDVLPMMVLKNR
jgi:hypothetical protein